MSVLLDRGMFLLFGIVQDFLLKSLVLVSWHRMVWVGVDLPFGFFFLVRRVSFLTGVSTGRRGIKKKGWLFCYIMARQSNKKPSNKKKSAKKVSHQKRSHKKTATKRQTRRGRSRSGSRSRSPHQTARARRASIRASKR